MDLMAARRRLIEMQGLPSAYRRVEYLEGSGTQYIITDIPCQNISAEMKYYPTEVQDSYFMGAKCATGFQICPFGYYSLQLQAAYGKYYDIGNTPIAINHVESIMSNGEQTHNINGTNYTRYNSQTNEPDGTKFAIFGMNDVAQGTVRLIGKARIYKLSVKNASQTKIGDFVPCVRKADSKPGMYDTVSKTFYTNAGTGEFIIPS